MALVDKSKPFYIIRTPEFGTGAHYYTRPSFTTARGRTFLERTQEVPELWRATQSKETAIGLALKAAGHRGKQFDVFELRLVGSTAPPAAQWISAKKPRKAKRKVRR